MSATLASAVYLLCFLASAICATLLIRQLRRSGSPVLYWSAACFVFLALSNLLVVFDNVVLGPDVNLRIGRLVLTLLAVSVLLFGFIWEAEQD